MDKFIELMQKLAISAVFWVDDENAEARELDLDKIVKAYVDGLIAANQGDAKAAITPFLRDEAHRILGQRLLKVCQSDVDEDTKHDRIMPLLTQLLDMFPNPAEPVAEGLRKLPGPLRGAEKQALISLFKQEGAAQPLWTWRPFSFTEWTTDGIDAVKTRGQDEAVLVIIDLQNTSESVPADGRTVLAQIADAKLDRKFCHLIVLTSECKLNDEFRRGRTLTEDFFTSAPDKRVPVFALSKGRFDSSRGDVNASMVSAFSNILERTDLSLVHLQLGDLMREHFIKSVDTAFNALDRITIEELMYAVTHTSKEEGVSEIETLVRLLNIAQREAFQQAIVDNSALRSTILSLRRAELTVDREQLESDKEIEKLRCAELYDKPEVINKLYSAVSPGDLFLIAQKTQAADGTPDADYVEEHNLYVLTANACDLMLRGDATRRLKTGLLLKLDDEKSKEKSFGFTLPHLEFTGASGASKKQAELREYVSISLDVLDLCWSNDTGKCVWTSDPTRGPSGHLLKSQVGRLKQLNDQYRNFTDAHLSALVDHLSIPRHSTYDDQGTLTHAEFSLRRVGRLTHSHAAQLVSRFASVFGRMSAEHDFIKQE